MSVHNLVYWLVNPLGEDELRALRRLREGPCRFGLAGSAFTEAYLIARGCVEADFATSELTITDKGLDGLKHLYEERT